MRQRTYGLLLAVAMLAACATEVKRQPIEISVSIPELDRRYELRSDVSYKADQGYPRSLPARTEFAVAGRLSHGLVLRPTQTVMTVEGAHMHEAYAVWRDEQLVGFYLPVEKAFSPLQQATPFPLVERKK
jgi:hypothetical protein